MIIGLQLVALIFSLFMIYEALLNYKKGNISRIELYIWEGIWAFTLLVIVFPERLQGFAKLYFARTFDMMVAGAFIVVLYMVTRAYLSTKKTEKKIEGIVRSLALKDVKSKKRK